MGVEHRSTARGGGRARLRTRRGPCRRGALPERLRRSRHGQGEGDHPYDVQLAWDDGILTGTCTCPHFLGGNFCKHLVAVGLAVLDEARTSGPLYGEPQPRGPVEHYLEGLEATELRELVLLLARTSPAAEQQLETTAALATGDTRAVQEQMTATARSLTSGRRDEELEAALATAENRDWPSGDTVIALALHIGDVERAWAAADRWGVGENWQELADAEPQPRPDEAIELYRRGIERTLTTPGRANAKAAAEMALRMRRLIDRADAADPASSSDPDPRAGTFAEWLEELKVTYRRRPTVRDEFTRAGL